MTDDDTALATTLREHARRHSDVLDLAAALALHLLPAKRDEENWLGREDRQAKGAGLLAAIERDMPGVPAEATTFLEDAGLAPQDLAQRAYAIVDVVDHIVGSRAHPGRPPLDRPWTFLLNRLRELGRYNPTASLGSIIPAPYNGGRATRDPNHIGRRLRFTRPLGPYVLRYSLISGIADPADDHWSIALVPAPLAELSIQERRNEVRDPTETAQRTSASRVVGQAVNSTDVPEAWR